MADYAIKEIEGIGETHTPKFQAVGIKTVAGLLERGKTRKAGSNWLKPRASAKNLF